MATWAYWVAVIGAIQSVIAAIGLGALVYSLKLNRDSARAAIRAADAAQKTAEATLAVELPRFTITKIAFLQNLEPRCTFVLVKNNGRTPAELTRSCLTVAKMGELPPAPLYNPSNFVSFGLDTVAAPDDERMIRRDVTPSRDDLLSVADGQTKLWVYGFFEYSDFLKMEHRDGFCAVWIYNSNFESNPTGALVGEFVRGGPPAYTYSRYKTEDDE